jgi:two-component system LytT family response regulator
VNTASQPLRVLIVDDELPARQRVEELLLKMPQVEIVGCADNGNAAVAAIRAHDPDLVLLDVQMPGMTAFDVIKEIGVENMPSTIFVTAYDRYALKAFDLAAIDYLLKPFDDERFEQSMDRAQQQHELKQLGHMAARLRKALEAAGFEAPDAAPKPAHDYLERIAVESRGQLRAVSTAQIDYITASGVYAELHVGEKTYVIRERIQTLEERLDPHRFFRIHRSVIVQLDRIDVLIRQAGGDYTLKLKNGAQLTVGRSRLEQLERWMGRD